MKKLIVIPILVLLALTAAACGGQASSSQPDTSNSAGPAQDSGTPAPGLSGLQLAAGMLKLEGTSNAVTSQEAAKLLPLWQSLQQIESTPAAQGTGTPGPRFNPAVMQQANAQLVLIENAMTPDQIQAITAMNLNRQDIFTVFQQAGISMGGPGFGPNGGTFTPPQGTPRADRTPGAFQGNGGFGGRGGFGFLPPSVVDGMVQFLQKKAGA